MMGDWGATMTGCAGYQVTAALLLPLPAMDVKTGQAGNWNWNMEPGRER